jgi:hypothetical protein
MEKFRRIVKWLFLGAGLLLLLVITAVVIYARSEHFTRWLRGAAGRIGLARCNAP